MTTKQRLLEKFVTTKPSGWYNKSIKNVLADIVSLLSSKSEVRTGGVVTAGGSITASVLQHNMSALDCTLNGQLKLTLAAQTNADLFATAGSVGRATYSTGADASGITLGTDETARVTVVATNSNGAGAATGDNGAVILVALVAGTGTTFELQDAFLTDSQIDDALAAATGVHAGATGWVRLANILWDENSASPTVTITVDRDC